MTKEKWIKVLKELAQKIEDGEMEPEEHCYLYETDDVYLRHQYTSIDGKFWETDQGSKKSKENDALPIVYAKQAQEQVILDQEPEG